MQNVLAKPHAQHARLSRNGASALPAGPMGLSPSKLRDTLCTALGALPSAALPVSHWLEQGGVCLTHGEPVFEAGARDDKVWLLLSGRVALGRHDGNGRWWQSRTVDPGHWIDLTTAWADTEHTETALALGNVRALGIELEALSAWVDTQPTVARKLLRDMARHSTALTLQRQTLLTQGIQSRVAAWVLEQAAQHAPHPEWPIQQKKKALASQLGATPETLSRCLRQLHERDLIILKGYQVRVLDATGLQRLAESPTSPPT